MSCGGDIWVCRWRGDNLSGGANGEGFSGIMNGAASAILDDDEEDDEESSRDLLQSSRELATEGDGGGVGRSSSRHKEVELEPLQTQ